MNENENQTDDQRTEDAEEAPAPAGGQEAVAQEAAASVAPSRAEKKAARANAIAENRELRKAVKELEERQRAFETNARAQEEMMRSFRQQADATNTIAKHLEPKEDSPGERVRKRIEARLTSVREANDWGPVLSKDIPEIIMDEVRAARGADVNVEEIMAKAEAKAEAKAFQSRVDEVFEEDGNEWIAGNKRARDVVYQIAIDIKNEEGVASPIKALRMAIERVNESHLFKAGPQRRQVVDEEDDDPMPTAAAVSSPAASTQRSSAPAGASGLPALSTIMRGSLMNLARAWPGNKGQTDDRTIAQRWRDQVLAKELNGRG